MHRHKSLSFNTQNFIVFAYQGNILSVSTYLETETKYVSNLQIEKRGQYKYNNIR